MNTDYLHSEWTKMKIESIKVNEKQVRLSVSLKLSCIKVIDEFKTERGFFNGRSDFILAAIRNYYFILIEMADSCLAKQDSNIDSDEKIKRLKTEITKDIDNQIQAYNMIFKGEEKLQISIYVSNEIYDCVNDIQILSGKKIGEIIQAAIASYRMDLFLKLHLRTEFISSLNKIIDEK